MKKLFRLMAMIVTFVLISSTGYAESESSFPTVPSLNDLAALQSVLDEHDAISDRMLIRDDPDILDLLTRYYTAVASKDAAVLSSILDPWNTEIEKEIFSNDMIESYENITTYSKAGPAEDSYVVYTYYEAGITGISTTVPSLSLTYITRNSLGKLVVSDRNASQEVVDFINSVSSDADIQELIADVGNKCDAAINSDPALKAYMDSLSDMEMSVVTEEQVNTNPVLFSGEDVQNDLQDESESNNETVSMTDVLPAYQNGGNTYKEYSSSKNDKNEYFTMAGIKYYDGMTFNADINIFEDECWAVYYLDKKYDRLEFTLCHVDGTDLGNENALQVIYDGVVKEEIGLAPDMAPKSVSLDVSGVTQLKLRIGASGSDAPLYGLGNPMLFSGEVTQKDSQDKIENTDETVYMTDSLPAYQSGGNTYKEYSSAKSGNSEYFTMAGIKYYNGMTFNADINIFEDECWAVYYLDKKYNRLEFTLCHVDGTDLGNENALQVIYDGVVKEEIGLAPDMAPKFVSLDVSGVTQLKLRIGASGNDGPLYGLGNPLLQNLTSDTINTETYTNEFSSPEEKNDTVKAIREIPVTYTVEDEYLFYDVSTRYLTASDVQALTAQQACYAKNEVYAIHGRKFVSVELQEYFGSKSWYCGTVEPSQFSDSVFNDYERANIQALVNKEEELCPGGYQLDKDGYDINQAGTVSLKRP